ncbi:E3 ubiquitin-protein ligase MIB2-like [Strongylocentrotus purpuratus]|uniref:RING-type E3 ubiquitin transferase n=1 Tax=Strongylocentrotus purpuratus TaxID=7668 RepID=A0A7M7NXW0_STRPU|nr:E3 ubiquitin-protein ligase MIB2-like [Strongylocentrotus purpuratus]
MEVGTRVVRGPDWRWSDQDNGEGHLGTVVTIGKRFSNPAHPKIVVVCWDMGNVNDYQAGFDENYDLLIYDNAAAGVKHNGVMCGECKEDDIAGMRWKCSSCQDYDLCNKCYMTSKHDLKHSFLRIIIPKSAGKLMSPRAACRKTEAKGSFPGAKVCRGRDWKWQEQDGGSGHTGVVFREANWANIQRSAIAVHWEVGGAYEYRVGHDGKVDIKCLKATSGYAYYKDHLPKFGEFNALEIGDRVVVKLDKDVLKPLQENHGGWVSGMEKFIGKVGRLASLTANSDVRIKYPNGQMLIFNTVAVTKLPSFNTGDKVRVMSDQAAVKELQKEHGGWNSKMSKALGEEGRVLNINADGDVKVNVGGAFWTFNPEALSMVEQGTGSDGIFEQDIRAGVMAHLLKQLLDPLGLVDSDEIRQMMTAAATEAAANEGEVTAQSAKEFIKAVMEGDVKRVAEALKKNKGFVNVVVQENTPLHLAAYQDHFQVVELLIKNGAKLNVKDDDGDTALANAVHQDNARIVKYLLDHGSDPNTTNVKGGRSPLHIGASKNHTQCVRLILGKGGTPNAQKEITELLINARNIDLELNNKRGYNLLHHAALTDNPHATRLLIKKQGSLVDIQKDDGYAALHLAVHMNNRNIAEILITEGHCAIDLYNEQHQTPLLLAVANGRTAIIEDLIKHDADINSSDGDGDSCLHIAVMKYRQGQDISDTDNLRTHGHTSKRRVVTGKSVDVKVGDHQSSVLSPLLFIIVMNVIAKDIREGFSLELLYADDLVLMAKSETEKTGEYPCGVCYTGVGANSIRCTKCRSWIHRRLSGICGSLQAASKTFICKRCLGTISQKCTKDNVTGLDLHGTTYDKVDKFCYLEDMLAVRGGETAAVTAKIQSAWKKFRELSHFLTSRATPLRVKEKVYDACVRKCMTYGSEAWAMKSSSVQRMEKAEMRTFRKKYREHGITKPLTALMCYLVQEGADISQTNLKKHTPLKDLKEVDIQNVLEYIAIKVEREKREYINFFKLEATDGGQEKQPSTSSGGSNADQHDRNDPSESPRGPLSDESFCGFHVIMDPKKVIREEMIGKGGFGEVWKGQWEGKPVAVKVLTTDGSQDSEVEKEIAIHKCARHRNIVRIMAVCHQRSPAQALIVMQLIEGSNLNTVIFLDDNPFDYLEKVELSKDLLSAVTFLHQSKILHLDIKPHNVIVESKTKKPYLCDLGLAHIKTRSIMSCPSLLPARGTIRYMPPECFTRKDGNMPASSACDVWSLACTLLEVFSGQCVWPTVPNPAAVLCNTFAGADVMPASVKDLAPNIKKILKPCFQKEPSERPSAESMMQQFSGLSCP